MIQAIAATPAMAANAKTSAPPPSSTTRA